MRAPFPPLIADAQGLDAFPAPPLNLITRMAAIYGVNAACVLPTQGAAQALALVMRRAALDNRPRIAGTAYADLATLARVNRVAYGVATNDALGAQVITSPTIEGALVAPTDVAAHARSLGDGLLVMDESFIEFETAPSAIELISDTPNLIVLRDLSYAYGLAGAPCAALVAQPALIERLREAEEPGSLASPIVRLAEAALAPHSQAANAARVREIREARQQLSSALPDAREAGGPYVWITPTDRDAATRAVARFGLDAQWRGDRLLLAVGGAEANDRARAAFAGGALTARRQAEIVRDTQETRIVVRVDLDSQAAPDVATGIGFYDHMLTQIAFHGGFSLSLACDGDLEIDAHHTIEDCALALGQALKQALGARRGLTRFGFVLPMDEAEARVSVDLGGRPFLVFDGAFTGSHIGAYPTEMTEHVFRSLSQSMAASVHVHVAGENDHHKTEACFKAFGRALRQALRVEGNVTPSTKGVL